MGANTAVVIQKIFQLTGLTNAVSVYLCICLYYLNSFQSFLFFVLNDPA